MNEDDRLKRIEDLVVWDPISGQPVFVGTCVPVRVVAAWVQASKTKEALRPWFPAIAEEMMDAAPLWVRHHPPVDDRSNCLCERTSTRQIDLDMRIGIAKGLFELPDKDAISMADGRVQPWTELDVPSDSFANDSGADEIPLRLLLESMQRAAVDAIEFVQGFTKADFMGDKRTRKAVLASFYLLAEAAAMIVAFHPAYAVNQMQVPWKALAGMRPLDLDVDWDVVWKLVQDDLPGLLHGPFIGEATAA